MHTLHPWAAYAVSLLHLWLIIAYVLDSQRTGHRHSWAVGIIWFAWLILLALIPVGAPDEFYLSTSISVAVLSGLPLLIILLHLLGKGQFEEYHHPRDILLLRQPDAPPASLHGALWQSLGIGAVAIVLALLSAADLSLRTCHWLDQALAISGCQQIWVVGEDIQDLAFSPDGNQLTFADSDGIHVRSVPGGQMLMEVPYEGGATSVAFSADGQLLASGGREQYIQIWQTTGGLLKKIPTRSAPISVAISPDSQLVSAGIGASVHIWRIADGSYLWRLPTLDIVSSVEFSLDGQWLAASTKNGVITIWRVADGRLIQNLAGPQVYQIAVSPNGALIASGLIGGKLDLWRLSDKKRIWSFIDPPPREPPTGFVPPKRIWSVAFSPDGAYFLGVSSEQEVRIWRTTDFASVTTLAFNEQIRRIAVHPKRLILAIGSRNDIIRLWRMPQE
jgi:WD40 repeat protein